MADTLLVRLAPRLAGIRDWMLVDSAGQTRTPVQTGAPAAAVIGGARRVVVLVPGEDVALHAARVPVGRNRQRLLRAIPFALEEQLASDIEDLHFAIGKPDGDQYPVAVVARGQMDAWARLLREAGISAHQWVPETLAVPHGGAGWDLLPDGERILVRTGDCSGFTCDADTLEMMMTLVAAEERLPAQARVYGAAPLALEGVEVILDETQVQPLDILARGWSRGPVIDLLQGAYSRREEWGRLLRPWKATAALLLAGVLLAALSTGINYYRLTQQQQQLTADIEALYKQTFPNARRIVNPRAQMEQELQRLQRRAGGSDADFLGIFAATASVVRGAQGIRVQGASYRDGRLDLELQADNLQLLDSLKQALVSSGRMTAEIQSATTENNQKVKSRIRIEARAS